MSTKSMKGIRSVYKRGGIKTYSKSREVILKPWIHLVIEDAAGENELSRRFYHHKKCSRLYSHCMCDF